MSYSNGLYNVSKGNNESVVFDFAICVIVFSSVLLSSCSYNLASYLKPKSLEPAVYHFSFVKSDDPVYRRLEAMYGSVGQGDTVNGELTIIYKTINIDGSKAYFAIDVEDASQKNPSLGSAHFLNSAMIFSGDSVLLASLHRKRELERLRKKDFDQSIPPRVKPSDTLIIVDKTIAANEKQLLLYDFKKEAISIGNLKLKNCLVITITEKWPETSYTGKVWLHKDYGVVKWIRTTGRLDERKF